MSQTAEHSGTLSLDGLQRSLWLVEAGLRKLTKIEVAGTKTKSTHDDVTRVPRRSLVLALDPNGNSSPPAGTDPNWVVRGHAMINSEDKLVAAFRKAAA